MGSLVEDCPHCGAIKVGFTIQAEFPVRRFDSGFGIAATCNSCLLPICAVLKRTSTGNAYSLTPKDIPGNILDPTSPFVLVAIYPSSDAVDVPANIPPQVASAFRQGSASRRGGHFDAACGMYRRSMELALKALSPDIDAWKIEKRIDRMAKEQKITPELQAWAHELRLDGNDAMHAEEDATREMADQMHELCRSLLIYLYTLPNQVEAAKARRSNA